MATLRLKAEAYICLPVCANLNEKRTRREGSGVGLDGWVFVALGAISVGEQAVGRMGRRAVMCGKGGSEISMGRKVDGRREEHNSVGMLE